MSKLIEQRALAAQWLAESALLSQQLRDYNMQAIENLHFVASNYKAGESCSYDSGSQWLLYQYWQFLDNLLRGESLLEYVAGLEAHQAAAAARLQLWQDAVGKLIMERDEALAALAKLRPEVSI